MSVSGQITITDRAVQQKTIGIAFARSTSALSHGNICSLTQSAGSPVRGQFMNPRWPSLVQNAI